MILIDSSVWIPSLRRRSSRERAEVDLLLERDEVATTDVVVAEVLQGAKSQDDYLRLADKLEALHFFHADESCWQRAMEMAFQLRRRGMTTALSDLLVAAVALQNDLQVYANDSDFDRVPELSRYVVPG